SLAASVDPTDARRRAADRRSSGGERNLILWPHKGGPHSDHPTPGRPGRVTTSAVRVAAGGSRSGFPRLGTVSKRSVSRENCTFRDFLHSESPATDRAAETANHEPMDFSKFLIRYIKMIDVSRGRPGAAPAAGSRDHARRRRSGTGRE